jgi:hypothetical protein
MQPVVSVFLTLTIEDYTFQQILLQFQTIKEIYLHRVQFCKEFQDTMQFITEDANHKYIKYIVYDWLDEEILRGSHTKLSERIK